jgi:hypothetical protein
MGEFVEFAFDDETAVLMEVFPTPSVPVAGGAYEDDEGEDVPAGAPPLTAVGFGSQAVARARHSLTEVLRPLVPVLHSVHQTALAVPRRPDSVTVTLGVKLSNRLQLGIVGGNGEASLTVSATWALTPAGDTDPPEADDESQGEPDEDSGPGGGSGPDQG